ncbi:PTS beta-glucoside transporter subunit IIABC [Leuconostoc citreum]|uniref:beta-glucoside-specific PTS transporter subunit IIABC n=1 Tax=Leuconostoc citreum TaxID=33964 RepID=UPI000A1E5028|nr:beta-glucoside-specific PTS transporter subunit IIABC [Leuconostoc citreum]OSP81899.1 PTS beta-glucoside transporter subunit IIABC [Leuconostoc citreum]
MNYETLAKDILGLVGGKANINEAWHCATRLRFKLKDENKAQTAEIEALPGVVTVVKSAGQYQVVIGNSVAKVFEPLAAAAGLEHLDNQTHAPSDKPKENIVNRFISFISSVFTPFLGAMAGTGVLKGLLALLVAIGWLDKTSGTYQIWYAAGDAFFFFLPIWLAFTAAKQLKVNQYVAGALAGALLYPSLATVLTGTKPLDFLGIRVIGTTYSSSVIPILLAVWLLSYLQPALDRAFHESIRNILTPLVSLLIMVPLTLLVVGPLGTSVGTVLSSGVESIYNVAPYVAGAVMGAMWQVFVIFGVHWTFVPVMTNNIGQLGHDYMLPMLSVAVLSQAGATLGVFLKTKDKKMKALAGSAVLTGILGITEPAIYGVTLKLKKPFIFSTIAGGIGGAIAGGGGAQASAFTLPSLLALPTYLGKGFMSVVVGIIVAFVLAAVLTYWFGVPSASLEKTTQKVSSVEEEVMAPVSGTIVPLSTVKDEVFASGAMGRGIAIVPEADTLVSPIKGKVVAVYPSKHAIGLISDDGLEILLHVGIDTVQLNGEHFEQFVKQDQQVDVGDKLLVFDREAIQSAGYDITVMMIITNAENYNIRETEDTATNGNWLLAVAPQ